MDFDYCHLLEYLALDQSGSWRWILHLCWVLRMLIFKGASSDMTRSLHRLQIIGEMILLLRDELKKKKSQLLRRCLATGDSALLSARRKLFTVGKRSRHSKQNLQFPFRAFIAFSIGHGTEFPFVEEGRFSLLNTPVPGRSVQCSVQSLRVLGSDPTAVLAPQPWQKQWISLLFHVVWRRNLTFQQTLLNFLLAQDAHRGPRVALKCQDFAEISFEVN